MQEKMRYLVVIETQKVKSYLFASPAMREIRGASIILDRLNRIRIGKLLKDLPPDKYRSIYLGGGSGRVLFSDKDTAETFCENVRLAYRKDTVNARVAAIVEIRLSDDEPYHEWQARGLGKTHQQKTGRREAMDLVAGRWVRPCSSCGTLPAERMREEHGMHQLCHACWLKREEVNELYQQIKPGDGRLRWLKPACKLKKRYGEEFIYTTLARMRERENNEPDTLLPQDFEDIGNQSKPKNYMGFIYADGNRMGDTLLNFKEIYKTQKEAIEAQRAFSEIVDQACREAAVEAVLETVPLKVQQLSSDRAKLVPAEFIMAGGDDLMLVVPAQHALEVTIAFLDKYQAKTQCLQEKYCEEGKLCRIFNDKGLTASAGVVLAHSHYPVRHLMELSVELMKVAKKKAAKQQENESCGTLDFMVISDAGSAKVGERRKNEYRTEGRFSLTDRPYTTDDMRLLIQTIKDLKRSDVPRGKLKKLYASLFQSCPQAQFDGLQIRERLESSGQLKPGSPLANLFETLELFPFRAVKGKEGKQWVTPLSEIIEFYDYVHP